jgi:hypothetical protein
MEKKMADIDDKITSALEKEEAELFREFDSDQNLHEMIADSYRSRNRWFIIMMDLVIVFAMVVMIVAGWLYFSADTVKGQIMYAVLFLCGGFAMSQFKQWHWMQINRNSMIREIKRVELQITALAKRLGVAANEDARR